MFHCSWNTPSPTPHSPWEGLPQGAGEECPATWIQEEVWGFRPGCGPLDQLSTPARVLEVACESAQPVHICFVDLKKACDVVPQSFLWGVLWEYWIDGILIRVIQYLYCLSQSLVDIVGSKSEPFPFRVGLLRGWASLPVLFRIFIDRISRSSQAAEGLISSNRYHWDD